MNYAKIKHFDIANGEGVRMSLFVSGCKFHCKDCFNQETWDYKYGELYTQQTENELFNLINNPNIDGLSLLGGDPLWQDDEGLKNLINLVDRIRLLNKTVWLWSGFTWEEIMENGTPLQKELVMLCNVWVDGRFQIEKRDLRLKWRGSSNQRIIDVQASLKNNKIITMEG